MNLKLSKNLLILFLVFGVFGLAKASLAANHFIRDGAAGTSCADWGAACDSLPANLVRGDTYYIADGTYSGYTFDDAESGTSVITIKKATVKDHGIETGWNSTYGDGQAVWSSGVTFNTSYWVFDGLEGPTWSKTPSQYGFLISPTAYPIAIYNTSIAITNITVAHVAATAPSGDIEKMFVSTDNSTKSVNNVTISHCYANGWENTVWATSAGLAMNNWIFEYNVSLNGWGSSAHHGEDLNNNYSYLELTARFNLFEGRSGGSTGCIVCLNGPCQNYYIYGNVFKDMTGGDGCITGVHYPLKGVIYNNTFINIDTGYGNGGWIGHDVTSTVYNNLLYNMNAAMGSSVTKDYNAYFSTTNTPTESHIQTGTDNPFVNLSGGDFRLTSPTNAGTTFSSPYNLDLQGITRGSDGVWDRGALEFGGITPPNTAPAAPTGVKVI